MTSPTTTDQTPAQRKAEARERLYAQLIDCIDEAAAPALARIDELRHQLETMDEDDLMSIRKLLTGRAGT